jgi:hypothetical protein
VNQFAAMVTEKGTLSFTGPMRGALDRHLKTLVNKPVEVIVRVPQSKRSLDQNAYLHCDTGPARLLAEHWGVSIEEAKLLLMGECFGWHEVNGHQIPIKPHTSSMTVKEFSQFVEWVIPWAMTEFNVTIPLPGEVLS